MQTICFEGYRWSSPKVRNIQPKTSANGNEKVFFASVTLLGLLEGHQFNSLLRSNATLLLRNPWGDWQKHLFLTELFSFCFYLKIRNVLLTTSNASSSVAILKALNSKMKQTTWLVRLLRRARFSTRYVIWMVVERNVVRIWAAVCGEERLCDDTKNGCEACPESLIGV